MSGEPRCGLPRTAQDRCAQTAWNLLHVEIVSPGHPPESAVVLACPDHIRAVLGTNQPAPRPAPTETEWLAVEERSGRGIWQRLLHRGHP